MNKTKHFTGKTRLIILEDIYSYFSRIIQWNSILCFDKALEYSSKAEALIELLEVDDCGSIGGYDTSNECLSETGYNLFDRFLTVINKYNQKDQLENSIDEMKKTIIELR